MMTHLTLKKNKNASKLRFGSGSAPKRCRSTMLVTGTLGIVDRHDLKTRSGHELASVHFSGGFRSYLQPRLRLSKMQKLGTGAS